MSDLSNINNFDFDLPQDLIATSPLSERSQSRLLVIAKNSNYPAHAKFHNIINYLNSGDILVINNTKVMKARIFGYKKSGGKVEFLVIRSLKNNKFLVLINSSGPKTLNTNYHIGEQNSSRIFKLVQKSSQEPGAYEVEANYNVITYLQEYGEIPLPPYMKRKADLKDEERYQTIFAQDAHQRSVAAPTAGLHFDNFILEKLAQKNIKIAQITLHVGPGTFLPIRAQNIYDHKMHFEEYFLSPECAEILNQAKKNNNKIIPVGTTSMRVLEHNLKLAQQNNTSKFFSGFGSTNLFITPGYKFLACDKLVTNFHLPKSSLFILVSAIAGLNKIKHAYQEAIKKNYRFYSYGDACLLDIKRD